MDCNTSGIDSGNTRGGDNDHPLGRFKLQAFKESCLPRTSFPGEKYASVGMLNKIKSKLKILVRFCFHDPKYK